MLRAYRRKFGVSCTIGAGLVLSGCGLSGVPATATVTMIDRNCVIIETTKRHIDDPRGSGAKIEAEERSSTTGECKSVAEWEAVRAKRTKDIDGKALVHVDYRAPQDGSFHSGTLTFTGREDEFYALKAGDQLDIFVSRDDPARIRKG